VKPRPAFAALAAAALLALAACSSSATPAPPPAVVPTSPTSPAGGVAAPAPSTIANPVRLIIKAGAKPDKGARYGSTTVQGWLTADGTFPAAGQAAAETISLYTLPPGLDGATAAAQVGAVTDDTATVLTGPDWYAFLYPAADNSGTPVYTVPPATVAARLGGTPLPGNA
jgi:hypothetical protein